MRLSLRSSVAALALGFAVAATGAQAQRERDPLPLPGALEAQLRCLATDRQHEIFSKSRFGLVPTPTLPGPAERARLVAQAERAGAARSAPVPAAIATPPQSGLDEEALRAALAPASRRAGRLLAHLETIRSQVAQLRAAVAAAAALSAMNEAQRNAYDGPWPTALDYALFTGDSEPCKHPAVAGPRAAKRQLLLEQYAAFRYGEHYYLLIEVVDEAGFVRAAIPAPDAGGCPFGGRECPVRPEVAILPYWYSREAVRETRPGEPHPADAFRDSVDAARAAFSGADARFSATFLADASANRFAALDLQSALDREREKLAAWRHLLAVEAEAIAALRAAIAERGARLVALQSEIPAAEADIGRLEAKAATATEETARRAGEANRAAATVEGHRKAIEALALQCGGKSYPQCADDQAKRSYDRQRFDLYNLLSAASQALFDAQTALQRATEAEMEIRYRIGETQMALIDKNAERAEARIYLSEAIPERDARQAKWDHDNDRAARLTRLNDADRGTVDALVLLIGWRP